MAANRNYYARDNRGFHGEPPDQFIPSRPRERNSTQDGFYGSGWHSVSHESIQMQTMGQPSPMYQGMLIMAPGPYVPPVIAHYPHEHPGNRMQVPADQRLVRDSTTPMPTDHENDRPRVQPSIGGIIFKRIISSLFIILDICLNWMQFGSWVGNFELPGWLDFLEIANSLKGKSPLKSQCDEGSFDLTTTFGAFIGIGTAYGLVRIVNTIGETIVEYQKQYPSETEPRCRGFQILHGWMETTFAILCDDLPQIILLVIFSWQCHIDYISMAKVLIWAWIKMMKNNFRPGTCKHIYKPCCGECFEDCCVDRYDFICCCQVLYFRPCSCCNDKKCIECVSYDNCPDCTCKRNERCCGEIDHDPEWALGLYEKLLYLYFILMVAIVVFSLLKGFGVLKQNQGFSKLQTNI
ncbi:uncharacterized protein LOC123524878 [Mercenaria mercenaria]|uniref:uncharacterized protein LOC123524878 n=1 Tax=Mercenaria mercenaria TaxID=6596 RepID=UPI00234ECA1A|nr:uncharacterized protein LOC123524878 [Mercenaria mercenaria]